MIGLLIMLLIGVCLVCLALKIIKGLFKLALIILGFLLAFPALIGIVTALTQV